MNCCIYTEFYEVVHMHQWLVGIFQTSYLLVGKGMALVTLGSWTSWTEKYGVWWGTEKFLEVLDSVGGFCSAPEYALKSREKWEIGCMENCWRECFFLASPCLSLGPDPSLRALWPLFYTMLLRKALWKVRSKIVLLPLVRKGRVTEGKVEDGISICNIK